MPGNSRHLIGAVARLIVRSVAQLGRLIGSLLPFHNPSGLFFFFPFYHTGGAEQVHADIVNCFTKERPWVFFVKRSGDRRYLPQFRSAARCFDFGWLLKYSYPFSVGLLAGLIGRHANPRVFGCNALFYYLLLPHLPAHVRATDLLHGMGGGVEQFALPVLDRLAERVVISAGVRDQLLAWYRGAGVEPALDSRIRVIANRVTVSADCPDKELDGPLQVLFVGRGSAEKRIHLVGRTARLCAELGINAAFTLVGDVADWLEPADLPFCTLTGVLYDQAALEQLYRNAHLIVITSNREGFPLTVMEGMAQGCVPVCTSVGGIPEHVVHQENGWLLPAEDDAAVVEALYEAVVCLNGDRTLLVRLSLASHDYALKNFDGGSFCMQYQMVVLMSDCSVENRC